MKEYIFSHVAINVHPMKFELRKLCFLSAAKQQVWMTIPVPKPTKFKEMAYFDWLRRASVFLAHGRKRLSEECGPELAAAGSVRL